MSMSTPPSLVAALCECVPGCSPESAAAAIDRAATETGRNGNAPRSRRGGRGARERGPDGRRGRGRGRRSRGGNVIDNDNEEEGAAPEADNIIVDRALDILLGEESTSASAMAAVTAGGHDEDTEHIEQERALRREQDEAFERALEEDARKEAIARAAAEAEAAERARRVREEEEMRRAVEESRRRDEELARETERVLSLKTQRIVASEKEEEEAGKPRPPLPPPLSLGVRFPDGSRHVLRVRETDPVSLLFDRLDVLIARGDPLPGTYHLASPTAPAVLCIRPSSSLSLKDAGIREPQLLLVVPSAT